MASKVTQFRGFVPNFKVYIDEAGIDNRLFRMHGRALRDRKIYADIPGKNQAYFKADVIL